MNLFQWLPLIDHGLFYLAAINLAVVIAIFLYLYLGQRKIYRLKNWPAETSSTLPQVCIIVPARNEQRHIAEAVRSLLTQDYPDLRVIAVNDRSTDQTGALLDEAAREDPRLEVIHLTELPAGWLGKNHALHLGAERAESDFVLFTDADVFMRPSTIRRAVGYMTNKRLDHLAMTPEVKVPGLLLESFVSLFTIYFSVYFRPWNAKVPSSKCYVGIGAFNLVRTEVYRNVGGHQRLAMRPDDDVMLGKVIKLNGYRQEMATGMDLIMVPWYGSVREMIGGLEKNAFAGTDYSIAVTVFSSLIAVCLNAWPFAAIFLTTGWTQCLYIATAAILLYLAWFMAAGANVRRISAVLLPLAVLLFVYVQWRTMLLTLANGGIRWRDTHYSLAELKANRF